MPHRRPPPAQTAVPLAAALAVALAAALIAGVVTALTWSGADVGLAQDSRLVPHDRAAAPRWQAVEAHDRARRDRRATAAPAGAPGAPAESAPAESAPAEAATAEGATAEAAAPSAPAPPAARPEPPPDPSVRSRRTPAPPPPDAAEPPPPPAPALPPAAPAPQPATATSEYEDRLVTAANAERTARGLPALARSGCADRPARQQAERMRAAGRIFHQDLHRVLDSCGGNRAAENVGFGDGTPERLVELWMASDGHRRVLLDPALSELGSGAVRHADGRWFASHVFLGR